MTREAVELIQQRARAEIKAAKGREARHRHLLDVATRHGIELPAIPIDDELAVARAVAILDARGVALDLHLLNPLTADQILAGYDERHP